MNIFDKLKKAIYGVPSPAELPLGTIIASASTEAGVGWLLCDGSIIDPKYEDLIANIQHTHTPDLQGRTILGAGAPLNDMQSDNTTPGKPPTDCFSMGDTGGNFEVVLSMEEIPTHTHSIPIGNYSCKEHGSENTPFSYTNTNGAKPTSSAGAGGPHCNMQPYYVLNFYIYAGK